MYIKNITVELESNCRRFMSTRKYPVNQRENHDVTWVEEWKTKDGEMVKIEFTRGFYGGYEARDKSFSFAFKLASGLDNSLSKNKNWTKYGNSVLKGDGWSRWEELKDLYNSNLSHPAPRVDRVVVSVMFG